MFQIQVACALSRSLQIWKLMVLTLSFRYTLDLACGVACVACNVSHVSFLESLMCVALVFVLWVL